MTATAHAVIGTVIAAKIGNPALAIPIALASHLAADTIPHWDTATNGKKKDKLRFFINTALDVFAGFAVSLVILKFLFPQTNPSYAFIIIIASQFFDWATAPYLFFNIKTPPFYWIYKFQKIFDKSLDKPWGIINQVVILILLVAAAKIF